MKARSAPMLFDIIVEASKMVNTDLYTSLNFVVGLNCTYRFQVHMIHQHKLSMISG